MAEINEGTFFKFNDFFPNDIHKKIHNDLDNSLNWGLVQNSQTNKYPENVPLPMIHENKFKQQYNTKFWINILGGTIPMINDNVIHNPFYEVDLFTYIKNKIQIQDKFELFPFHIYANGQTVGQTGNWHQDSSIDTDWTFLYYVNTEWDIPKWGGSTYFCDFVKDEPVINLYKPNSAILFKSTIWHYADPPSLQSNVFRITLAYKLRLYPKDTFNYFEEIKNYKLNN